MWARPGGFIASSRQYTQQQAERYVDSVRRHEAAARMPVTATYPPAWPAEPTYDGEDACILCLERRRATVVVPCGHMYSCVTCMARTRPVECAMCKTRVQQVIKTFMS